MKLNLGNSEEFLSYEIRIPTVLKASPPPLTLPAEAGLPSGEVLDLEEIQLPKHQVHPIHENEQTSTFGNSLDLL